MHPPPSAKLVVVNLLVILAQVPWVAGGLAATASHVPAMLVGVPLVAGSVTIAVCAYRALTGPWLKPPRATALACHLASGLAFLAAFTGIVIAGLSGLVFLANAAVHEEAAGIAVVTGAWAAVFALLASALAWAGRVNEAREAELLRWLKGTYWQAETPGPLPRYSQFSLRDLLAALFFAALTFTLMRWMIVR